MREARMNHDYKLLLYYIRTRWVRNIGNMGDANLYRHAYVGTKRLIEEYIHECQVSLEYLINHDEVNLDDRYLLGMLIQTRKISVELRWFYLVVVHLVFSILVC